MALVSFQGRAYRELARSLFLVIAFFCVFSGDVHAQDQPSHVKITLRISFTFENSDAPESMEISIPRDGKSENGAQLKEIKALIEQGKLNQNQTSPDFALQDHVLVRPNTDFELTGISHQLVVKAQGFDQQSKELTDEEFRQAFKRVDKVLSISVVLAKPGASPSPTVSPSPSPGVSGIVLPISFESLRGWLKSIFWVLGLAGFCAVGLWVCLVLLAKLLIKSASMERWVLRLPSFVAHGLIWPFGFRLKHSLVSETEIQTASTSLQNINQGLIRLRQSKPATTQRADIQIITDNLAVLTDPTLSALAIKGSLDGIATSLEQLSTKTVTHGVEMPNTASHTPALKDAMDEALEEFKRNLLKEFRPDLLNSTPVSAMNTESIVAPRTYNAQVGIDLNAQQKARVLYQKLLDQQPLVRKPVFVEADTKSSILGKFADSNIYLLQVPSPQAPFVLFIDDSDDGTVGWVFPNIARGFDMSTLKVVFPGLNEAQFNEAREIEPVIVSKAGEKRWKVDRESGFFAG